MRLALAARGQAMGRFQAGGPSPPRSVVSARGFGTTFLSLLLNQPTPRLSPLPPQPPPPTAGHREIELSGGADRCSGRVRVRDRGTWGSLCRRGTDRSLAEGVCRYLGCGNASELGRSYPLGPGHAWVGQCRNGTGGVPACFRKVPPESCRPGGAAGVTCTGKELGRLTGGVAGAETLRDGVGVSRPTRHSTSSR
ncbi:hypothetical protein chiPu_0023108 [Chiloscyllium punctatum]|uniref:SRCR domain-containing protein n=1 Tax=Chiloscyllium punctatum TaxID=137246 RepID=A0A401T8Y1_CHIPU|nr:hypothetical protein [Chiloscyllium punctatum]